MRVRLLILLLLGALPALPTPAQPFRHLRQEHTPHPPPTLEAWLGRASALRTRIRVSTGLWPLPERTPLNPRLSPPTTGDGYTVQSVVLETYPGFYLTGNLYRPLDGPGPHPAVLSAHGHWTQGRFENTDTGSIPGRAVQFARMGYVVFSYSMVGYNETADLLPHRFDAPAFQLWGFTPMGLQLWNSLRALDFLSSLPDVDPHRIGMTGASGGATQTFMLTAIDPRIRVAAPVNMISAHFQGGCVCENAPLLRLTTHNVEIGALAAPRPLLLVSTSGDWTRNTPSVEYPAIRAIYRLFDAEDRVANVHRDDPHNYNRGSREAVYAWFNRWLKNDPSPVAEQPFQIEPPEVLTAEVPDDALGLEALFARFRARARQQIEAARPDGWPAIYAYRDTFGRALEEVLDPGPATPAFTLEAALPADRTGAGRAVLIVHPDDTTAAREAHRRADSLRAAGVLAFLLNPVPRPASPPDSIAHATTYNPTTASLRVNAIRAAATSILARPDVTRLDLVGLEVAGPWTLLVRALLPDVHATEVDLAALADDTDIPFLSDLFIPLLRRAGDVRTAAVMIAPAPLTLHGLPEGPLRTWFEDVYRAAGARPMLSVHGPRP